MEHWLVRLGVARRTGSGDINLRDGMNADWSGGNWRFTAVGTVALFVLSFGLGVGVAVMGRWVWTHV